MGSYFDRLLSRRRLMGRRSFATLLLVALFHQPVQADTVLFLTNGRRIVVDRFWEDEDQIIYEKNGGTFGFPRRLLERVDRALPASASEGTNAASPSNETTRFRNEVASESVSAARDSVDNGELEDAIDLYNKALSTSPESVSTRIELAELYFQRGDLSAAQAQLEQAKRFDSENKQLRELLGDIYYRKGRTPLAIREWQLALAIEPSPGLLYKLKLALRENDEDIDFEEVERPHFVIRYDGHVNQTIGRVLAAALDEEYFDLAEEFRFSPSAPIKVTLYMNQEFQDITHAPAWASALNDGEIRIPVEGLTAMTPRLRRVLRHELTHSFVTARTAGNCPSWFQEGLAQYRDGSESRDPYSRLNDAQREGKLLPFWSLEGPLINYSKEKALLAYAQGLAATEYIADRRGEDALLHILNLLSEQQPMNDALKKVVGLDYQEFQTAWEADLRRYRPRGNQ